MSQSIQRSNGANLKPRLFEAGFTLYFVMLSGQLFKKESKTFRVIGYRNQMQKN